MKQPRWKRKSGSWRIKNGDVVAKVTQHESDTVTSKNKTFFRVHVCKKPGVWREVLESGSRHWRDKDKAKHKAERLIGLELR